jgi:hypothetical protein
MNLKKRVGTILNFYLMVNDYCANGREQYSCVVGVTVIPRSRQWTDPEGENQVFRLQP